MEDKAVGHNTTTLSTVLVVLEGVYAYHTAYGINGTHYKC